MFEVGFILNSSVEDQKVPLGEVNLCPCTPAIGYDTVYSQWAIPEINGTPLYKTCNFLFTNLGIPTANFVSGMWELWNKLQILEKQTYCIVVME